MGIIIENLGYDTQGFCFSWETEAVLIYLQTVIVFLLLLCL